MVPPHIDEQVAAAVQRISATIDPSAKQQLEKMAARPGTRLLAAEEDACLFRMQDSMREEHPEYAFFLAGQLFEVRRLGPFSNRYSLAGFPPTMETKREWVQERFAALILTTADGLGWFDPPWRHLGDEQKAMCRPIFVADGLRFFSM
jgi:hypothetical protein